MGEGAERLKAQGLRGGRAELIGSRCMGYEVHRADQMVPVDRALGPCHGTRDAEGRKPLATLHKTRA